MAEALLNIADLNVRFSGDISLEHALNIPGMRTFLIPDGAPDIEVRLDHPLQAAPFHEVHRFEIADGHSECRVGIDAEGAYIYQFGASSLLRYDERRPGEVCLSTMEQASYLRFALWVAYSLPGLRMGRVPVHSSTVVHDGRAVMCLGESGTGKSTHTRLWLKHIPDCHLLNDDSPIVALRDGVPTAYGSPWSGKTHCYRQEHFPIAALLRLEQRPENRIRRLGTVEAFSALQPSCPPSFAQDEHSLDLLCDFISGIISLTPAYRLGCLPDEGAARLSHHTLFCNP
ncbi:MAG: hypothetical protein J6I49_05785 [Bacteroidales bacterium]|nr:hypothetical protein [Bacteroidales bacterium]